jgi:hypothetical protein
MTKKIFTNEEKHKNGHQRRKTRKRVSGSEKTHPRNSSAAEQMLQDAIDRQQAGLDGLSAAQCRLLRVLGRIERMSQQIDEAFAGQMFLPDLAPDAPANRRRAMTFLKAHTQVSQLLGFAITLWMRTCGMKLEDDWVP